MADDPSSPSAGGPRRRVPLSARLLGTGARGAARAAEVAGIDQALEAATEEAIVRAVESPAVERALVRVLRGPAVNEAVEGALTSPAVAEALTSPAVEQAFANALDSEMVDRVWRRLLASDEVQQLVERIAEAPEVRSAITSQGVGFLEDIGRQLRRLAWRLDDVVERVARRLLGRRRRTEPTDCAGLVSRALALATDGAIINAIFVGLSALVAFVVQALFGSTNDNAPTPALIAGVAAWVIGGSAYLVSFWALVGQTPGMRFLGIHLQANGSRGIGLRRAVRRLFGMVLAAIPLGAGFLPILYDDRRRGFHDRVAGTEVVRMETERVAPHAASDPPRAAPAAS